jgi:hypothetical protein
MSETGMKPKKYLCIIHMTLDERPCPLCDVVKLRQELAAAEREKYVCKLCGGIIKRGNGICMSCQAAEQFAGPSPNTPPARAV